MKILIIFKKKHSYLTLIFQFTFSLALLSNMPTRFTAKKCAWQWNSRVRWRKFGAFLSDMLCTASRHTFCLLMVRNEREDCPTKMGTVEKEWNNNKFRIIRIPRWAMMGLLCFILVFVFVTNNLPSTNPLGTTDRYVKKKLFGTDKIEINSLECHGACPMKHPKKRFSRLECKWIMRIYTNNSFHKYFCQC